MNEFIEQFILETRELAEQATADMLAMEKTPGDQQRLDSAFRAFHTLKGGAGIVDFTAMANAVHVVENVLASVKSGTQAVTPLLIGNCLVCIDQIIQWLDVMEKSGELPVGADEHAAKLVARFGKGAEITAIARENSNVEDDEWIDRLLEKNASVRELARVAVRYKPDRDCFFKSVDPLAHIAALPGLKALDIIPASPWGALDALDPFGCNIVLLALCDASLAEVEVALEDALDQCDRQEISSSGTSKIAQDFSRAGMKLLEQQLLLLAKTENPITKGCLASIGIVVANVLRSMGRFEDANQFSAVAKKVVNDANATGLREAVESLLNKTVPSATSQTPVTVQQEVVTRTLRIDAAQVDALVNLTGELTVAKNSIGFAAKTAHESANPLAGMMKERYVVLDRLISELQKSVFGMRVLPLRTVFQRFPRLMRGISADLNKPVNLVIDGDETKADKIIVEMLFEPLLHVLRNAIDHGIESATDRAACGKPAMATIHLRAFRQEDCVVIEVDDDGSGIDVAKVRQVATDRGVISQDDVAAMNDAEIVNLIFAPGFSTASIVTELSGRGVGMDAVRSSVERMAGKVNIESRTGQGTTVRFTLPFSVMMTPVMIVGVADHVYGIPLDCVIETLRVPVDSILPVGTGYAIIRRDKTLPLINLSKTLGIEEKENNSIESTIVIVGLDGHTGALQVDRIGDRLDAMLKPLDGILSDMVGVSGSTLLGDGSVLLILDPRELFR